jgi:hypothetical protein
LVEAAFRDVFEAFERGTETDERGVSADGQT